MNKQRIGEVLIELRKQRPLVQAITNYVTINDCANILLSIGASPAMCEAQDEVAEFVAVAGALYLNLGTLTAEQKEAMTIASSVASELGKPIVLDPVAAGGISRKTDFAKLLLEKNKISILKGNTGEIKSLAGFEAGIRGVDSTDDGENVIEACSKLAREYNTVVVASGQIDTISDGQRVVQVHNGHPALTMITGAGCMLGALTAATAAVEKDFFLAAVAAATIMAMAGEMAGAGMEENILPGTFRVRLFDSIFKITEQDIVKAGKLAWL